MACPVKLRTELCSSIHCMVSFIENFQSGSVVTPDALDFEALATEMTYMLQNHITIITGAAQGIGLACAERFCKEGAHVMLSDIDDERGAAAVQRLVDAGYPARYQRCDVTRKSDIDALFSATVDVFGRVDSVIANAAIVHSADILELDETDFDRVIATNLKGVFLTGQTAARVMIEQPPNADGSKGLIINMSSVNAVMTIPAIAPYAMAKGGVNQWTKSLSIRLANEGIRVNGIGPGSINTELFRAVANEPEKLHAVLSRTPMGRAGEADEVAQVAVFLASAQSSYVTGQTIYVDGGRLGLNYVVPVEDQ